MLLAIYLIDICVLVASAPGLPDVRRQPASPNERERAIICTLSLLMCGVYACWKKVINGHSIFVLIFYYLLLNCRLHAIRRELFLNYINDSQKFYN
jgi:hypothetical protein